MNDLLDDLNHDYYQHAPSGYIRTRIVLLLALCDESNPVNNALSGGLSALNIRVEGPGVISPKETDEFAVVESISLMYLSAEAMLRLFLAHRGGSNCAALSLASLTSFREFKKELVTLVDSPPSIGEVQQIFRGSVGPPEGTSAERWREEGEVTQFLIWKAADLLLNRPNVYNSVKHGLAVQPRKSSIRMGSEQTPGGVIIDHSGDSIRFLSKLHRRDGDVENWSESIEFVLPSTNLALATAFADEIDSIHQVGNCRTFGGTVSFVLKDKAFIDLMQTVPFQANYSGITNLAMKRNFQIARSCKHCYE